MKARFKAKYNIRKGDTVVVIAGDDKDLAKPRTVREVLVEEGKVIVEGVNIITKHTKPTAQNTKGGIVKKEAPIHISNVMLWDAKAKAAARVKRERSNGKTARISKKIRRNVMSTKAYKPRLATKYKSEVVPNLVKKFNYETVMQAPRLEKICVNRGINGAVSDKKTVDIAVEELTTITGQKAVPTMSKKDISNFKLRKGMPIGAKVTLRGEKMYEFLDRLISVALPRVRDFKGVNDKSFDGRGNYTLGVTEQIIFPEIDIDKVSKITGMDITFVTTANSDEEAFELLKEMGMPFKNVKNN